MGDVRPRLDRAQLLAQRAPARGDRVLVAGLGLAGVLAHLLLLAHGNEQPDAGPHEQDQQQAAGELGSGELRPEKTHRTIPISKTRFVEANMNATAAGSPAPF